MQSKAETRPPEEAGLKDKIGGLSACLRHLSTGGIARLRRGPLQAGDAGAPEFWKLAAHEKYGFKVGDDQTRDKWAAILQAMAILTPRSAEGGDNPKGPANEFGKALCDGGNADWLEQQRDVKRAGGSPRPVLSELRLAKMLAAKGKLRRELVVRAAKIIAKSETPVNCADIAWFILCENSDEPARRIARSYYAQLSRAERSDKSDQAGTDS
jgi:CRISPR system Cascade subunit CasB